MADLIYTAITSLDGYIEDETGRFDWSGPDPEVHKYVNDSERPVGTYLYGRRMYEVMQVWQRIGVVEDAPEVGREYAEIWRAADKVVYSTTLGEVATPRTRLERRFDSDAVRAMKATAPRDLSVSGPELAAHAFRAGLVDVVNLYVHPVVVGGGKRALPADVRLDLTLTRERRFGSGVVHLSYRVLV